MALLKIGIVGAGFTGTSFIALVHYLAKRPIEIFLFEKTGAFGPGIAYSTISPFHLLNVRASDMSILEPESEHFVDWLKQDEIAKNYLDANEEIGNQFVPRFLYGNYLKEILEKIRFENRIKIHFIPTEVNGIISNAKHLKLVTTDKEITVDKVILAIGNSLPATPSFPLSPKENYIANPWHSDIFKEINPHDSVMLLGSGLSMIDSVLTLYHQQHKGKIFSLSRHGLLPLPHNNNNKNNSYCLTKKLPTNLLKLTKFLRAESKILMAKEDDWRSLINAFRPFIPQVWSQLTLVDKNKFLRHGLAYWNIHRHRVPVSVMDILIQLRRSQQLEILKGRLLEFNDEIAFIRQRGSNAVTPLQVKWLINCTGPSLNMNNASDLLIQSLVKQELTIWDQPQNLSFKVSPLGALVNAKGIASSSLYAVGPSCKGAMWESTAVPEIRKQNFNLVMQILV